MSRASESAADRPASTPSRIDALVAHAMDAIIELGIDGRMVFVSPSIQNMLGLPPSHFEGRSFVEVVVPEDRATVVGSFRKLIETGRDQSVGFQVFRADGLRAQLAVTARVFETDDARRVVVVARDVTEQSASRAVESRRDAYHRRIVETGGRPAAVVSRSGEFLFSNRAFHSTFGRDTSLPQLIARMPSESRLALELLWYEVTREDGGAATRGDFAFENQDGDLHWFAATFDPFVDDDEQRAFVLVCEDVHARKEVELALRSIAQGAGQGGRPGFLETMGRIARALDFDRFAVGILDPEDPSRARIASCIEAGESLAPYELCLRDLPDATVAEGEACFFPTAATELMPAIAERFSRPYQSYAGLPLRRADGSVVGFASGYSESTIRDTSLTRSLLSAFATHAAAAFDRDRAEREIRATQDRFAALASQTHELLIELDPEGRIDFASPASEAILGVAPAALIGRSVPDFVHPEDRQKNRQAQASLFEGPGQTLITLRILHGDGSWRWIECRSASFEAWNGAERALVAMRDVTDRRHRELGRDLLYRVVQEGADLVLVCDPDAQLLFANEAARRRLPPLRTEPILEASAAPTLDADRVSPRELGATCLDDLLTTEDAQRFRGEILPQLAPATPWSGELALRGQDADHDIPAEATIFRFVGDLESGRSYLAVSLRDLEAHRSAEEALRRSESLLNQAHKMEAVGRLAGGIAHDFNNLLTAIIGYSDLVLEELGEGHGARRDAQEILRAAERAGGLTRQLLAFSRRQVLQPEAIDLNTVVSDVDRMMRRLIEEDIELVTSLAGELPAITADRGQIEQVIVNLVVNAQDAMPQGGRLELDTAATSLAEERRLESGLLGPGRYAVLSVSDSGIGMDAETRSQIFEPFFTTKETHQGTGLGLASVYGIVSQSGGQIDVDSTPGEGTRFLVYLPVGTEQAVEAPSDPPNEDLRGQETVLLVEDAAAVRHLVQRTLERNGYRVLSADSATGALRHCARHEGRIDLLLSDVVLPKTAGPEIAARARHLRPDLRVLYMSGFTDDTLSRHGVDGATLDLIEKPFTPTALLRRLRAALDRPLPDESPDAPDR